MTEINCPRCRAWLKAAAPPQYLQPFPYEIPSFSFPVPPHNCPDKRLFGYPVRLLIDLPGGEHDVTHCIEVLTDPHARAEISADHLLNEIEIEKRARARSEQGTKGRNDG